MRTVNTYIRSLQVAGLFLVLVAFMASCSTVKTVPKGRYLLNKAEITSDTKAVKASEFSSFLEQKPNESTPGLWIYNWGGNDTSRWVSRMFHKIGQAPVVYDDRLIVQSAKQIRMEMRNKGYLNANVEVQVDTASRKKKARVTYAIKANEPYKIRNYKIDMKGAALDSLVVRWAKRNTKTKLGTGAIFDMDKLEDERTSLTQFFRNMGYYALSINDLHYLADTTLNSNQVDLTLTLRDSVHARPYYLRSVSVVSGFDAFNQADFIPVDTVQYKDLTVFYDSTRFIRPAMLYNNVFLHPGRRYSDTRSTQTYNAISSFGSVQKTNISYQEIMVNDTAMLDAQLFITEGDIHGIQTGLDGTNKAGDLGVAANISYTHNNLFNGSEIFNIKLRGAYEFITGKSDVDMGGHNYYEAGISTSLKFPQVHLPIVSRALRGNLNMSTQYEVGFNMQRRPEYQRNFFNMDWKFNWSNTRRTITQGVSLVAINYVMMPWMSGDFKDYLNEDVNSLTKHSYEDIFTIGSAYNIMFTNSGRNKRVSSVLRFSVETSGNLLNAIFSATNAKKSSDGQYNILGNPFAQYVKADADYTYTIRFDTKSSVALHGNLGAAYALGNSTILPFEKRYYTGGSNSVRGWNSRHLGPGSFNGNANDVAVHTGDLTLTLNAEYRYKLFKYLEFATFVDGGNIWTLRNYENQPDGRFYVSDFYKEIGIGAGVGFRIDLSFLIIRLDFGKRVHDPARPAGERWTFFSEGFGGNSAFYFAIGYPF